MGVKVKGKRTFIGSEDHSLYGWGAPPAESRIPLLVFLIVTIVTLAIHSMLPEDPRDRVLAIRHWPVVEVSTQDLIDECGVFMWVKWVGPDFGYEEPYIPMRDRFR